MKKDQTTLMTISIVLGLIVILITYSVYRSNQSGSNGSIGAMILLGFMFLMQVGALVASLWQLIVNMIRHKERVGLSMVNFMIWAIGLVIWFSN